MSISGIFEPFFSYVSQQLTQRKRALIPKGLGRSENFAALAFKSCTIRMSSGVDIVEDAQNSKYKFEGVTDETSLAKRFVLSGTPTAKKVVRDQQGNIISKRQNKDLKEKNYNGKYPNDTEVFAQDGTPIVNISQYTVFDTEGGGFEPVSVYNLSTDERGRQYHSLSKTYGAKWKEALLFEGKDRQGKPDFSQTGDRFVTQLTTGEVDIGEKLQYHMQEPLGGIGSGGIIGNSEYFGDAKDGYGMVPAPGITDAEIRTKSDDGSLREAKINFVCYNKRQLDVLDALYMRPGYPVLLEWGWTPYITNDGDIEMDFEEPLSEWWKGFNGYSRINDAIRKRKIGTGGNYDGFVGYVKNYTFSVREDGGYNCTTELIAQGEMLESLTTPLISVPKLNYNDAFKDIDFEIVDKFIWILRSIDQFLRRKGDLEVMRLTGTGGEVAEAKWFWGSVLAPDWYGGDRNNLDPNKIEAMNYIHPTYASGWQTLLNVIRDVTKMSEEEMQDDMNRAFYGDDDTGRQYSLFGQGGTIPNYAGNMDSIFKGMIIAKLIQVDGVEVDDPFDDESLKKGDSGKRLQLFVRWDLLCQIMNKLCFPRYNRDEPMTEMNFLGPNQTTFHSFRDRFNKAENLKVDQELNISDAKYNQQKEYLKYSPPSGDITKMEKGYLAGNGTLNLSLAHKGQSMFFGIGEFNKLYSQEDFSWDDYPYGIYDGFHTTYTQQEAYMGHLPGFTETHYYYFKDNPDPEGELGLTVDKIEEGGQVYYKLTGTLENYGMLDGESMGSSYDLQSYMGVNANGEEAPILDNNLYNNGLLNMDFVQEDFNFKTGENFYSDVSGQAYEIDKDVSFVRTDNVLGESMDESVCIMPHTPKLFGLMYKEAVKEEFKEKNQNKAYVDANKKRIEPNKKYFDTCTSYNNIPIENNSIGFVYFNLDHITKIYQSMRFQRDKDDLKLNKKFSWHKFITRIWNDVNEATGDQYDFGLHLEHERPHVGRIIDYKFHGATQKNIFEFNPQGLYSVTRDFNYSSKISQDFASVISIAAQAPNQIHSLEALSFKAFHKGIKNRFSSGDAMEDEKNAQAAKDRLTEDVAAYYKKLKDLEVWKTRLAQGDYSTWVDNSFYRFYEQNNEEKPLGNRTAIMYAEHIFDEYIKIKKRYPLLCGPSSTYPGCVEGKEHPKAGQYRDSTVEKSAVIPLEFSIQLDGIGGIVPLQLFKINKDKLPVGYQQDEIAFIIKSETQKITSGQDWVTELTGQLVLLNVNYNIEGENPLENKKEENKGKKDADKIDNEKCKTAYTFGFSDRPLTGSVSCAYVLDYLQFIKKVPEKTRKAVFALMFAEASKYTVFDMYSFVQSPDMVKKAVAGFNHPGGHNYAGVQTDNAVWGGTSKDGSTGPIRAQYCLKDSGNVHRAFAIFEEDSNFLDFLVNIVVNQSWRGLNTDNGDDWTDGYIQKWWSPASKTQSSHKKGGSVFNQKKAIWTSAMKSYETWKHVYGDYTGSYRKTTVPREFLNYPANEMNLSRVNDLKWIYGKED